jgi:hypothetical protein
MTDPISLTCPYCGKQVELQSPQGYCPEQRGEILKIPILSGIHYHYFRKAA